MAIAHLSLRLRGAKNSTIVISTFKEVVCTIQLHRADIKHNGILFPHIKATLDLFLCTELECHCVTDRSAVRLHANITEN